MGSFNSVVLTPHGAVTECEAALATLSPRTRRHQRARAPTGDPGKRQIPDSLCFQQL